MTNIDQYEGIFLPRPHTNDGFIFSLTIHFPGFILKELLRFSKYAGVSHYMNHHFDLSMTSFDSYKQ